jgi:TRAP-type C4-dicarboxylate transport system permease small subunit
MANAAPARGTVARLINGIELTAASFLAAVTALTFVSVLTRYLLSWGIPDSYDVSRMLLGVLIFWGISVASFRSAHITVDLLWSGVGPGARRAIDLFADLVSLVAMVVFTWMMAEKVIDTWQGNIGTYDLRFPVWVFFLLAWIGLAAAILLLVVRTIRLLIWPDSLPEAADTKRSD